MNEEKFKVSDRAERDTSPAVADLLRLKRHERPEPESWEDFQREFRRRAMESVVTESVRSGRWQRILLRWFAPAFGLGAVAATFLIFTGGALVDLPNATNPNAGVAGGIIEKEIPFDISNVMVYNPAAKKGFSYTGFKIIQFQLLN